MNDEIRTIQAGLPASGQQPRIVQTGDGNAVIPNYGTINMTVNQQVANMPFFGGRFYVPVHMDREYYNIFVIGCEEFDRPYFKVPRDRALSEMMSDETKALFTPVSMENKARIMTLPSLFMAENNRYGDATDDQKVIYGFVSDMKLYENDVKIYYCGYKLDIPQRRLNELLEELELCGNRNFNEMNRTHWSIKRCDLIEELLEAGIQVPVFRVGNTN